MALLQQEATTLRISTLEAMLNLHISILVSLLHQLISKAP
jgi:hypothetical protein